MPEVKFTWELFKFYSSLLLQHPGPLILPNFAIFQQMKGDLTIKLPKGQKHLLKRNIRSQERYVWFIFLTVITQEHLAHFLLPPGGEAWSFRPNSEAHGFHFLASSLSPCNTHNTHKGPSSGCRLKTPSLVHFSQKQMRHTRSILCIHISPNYKWLPAGPVHSLDLY